MYAKVVLVGRLGGDPKVNEKGSVCHLNVATSNLKGETTWHNVSVFGKQIEIASKYLKKGSICLIEGRLDSYKDKNGNDRFTVSCTELRLLDKKEGSSPEPEQSAIEGMDSVPF